MKTKRECKIVQDLLPNYIEKLTNEETNQYIEEHLIQCKECSDILENMKKDIKKDVSSARTKKEIKYMKKYSHRMTLLKIIIITIVVLFVILTGRKILIINDLYDKAEEHINSTNYHSVVHSFASNNYGKTEMYSMGDKKKIIIIQEKEEGRTVTSMYAAKSHDDRYNVNVYMESSNGKKTMRLNQDMGIMMDPQNTLYTESWWQLFLYSIPASVRSTTFDGKECYYISNFRNLYSYCPEGSYIDKETGLLISTIAYESKDSDGNISRWPATERSYEFGTVTESDFTEPNREEYENVGSFE